MEDGRHTGDRVAHEGGQDSPDEDLPFGSDIEQPALEAEGHPQAAEDVGGGGDEALQNGIERAANGKRIPALEGRHNPGRVADGAGEERGVGAPGDEE